MNKNIRIATANDCDFILKMIRDLAAFERAIEKVDISVSDLIRDGFTGEALFKCLIAELDSQPVGMALFYNRYSTWMGKSLYLEDLYIEPKYRGNGFGLMTMKWLAKHALETECRRFEWQVLDWNNSGIDFYKRLNTELDGEWFNCRLEGQSLEELAKS